MTNQAFGHCSELPEDVREIFTSALSQPKVRGMELVRPGNSCVKRRREPET
jgi:hypothetical protein